MLGRAFLRRMGVRASVLLAALGAAVAILALGPAASASGATGPRVTRVGETGPSRGITGFRAAFSRAMEPSSVRTVSNYSLVGIRPSGRRVRIRLRSATYESLKRAVTVKVETAFMQTQFKRIEIGFNGHSGGLVDSRGRLLDGDQDGRAGGDARLRFRLFSGTTVTFTESDGDQATVSIVGGGRLDGIEPRGGPTTQHAQFWILDPIPLRSMLMGSVMRSGQGDGIVVIAELIGLNGVNFMGISTNSMFRVNTLTFTSNATGIG